MSRSLTLRCGTREALIAPILEVFDNAQAGDAVREPTPNGSSVVLALSAGDATALLGGDLDVAQDPERGWAAVRSTESIRGFGARMVKVPHHASAGADDPLVWRDHIAAGALHAVTRFNNGERSLPRSDDLDRLTARGASGHVLGAAQRRRHLYGIVGRRARSATKDGVWEVTGPVGHLRWRWALPEGSAPDVAARGETSPFGATGPPTLADARHSGPGG